MRPALLRCLRALLVVFVVSSAVHAQVRRPEESRKLPVPGLSVTSSSPSRVELFQQRSAEIVLHGDGFQAVNGAEVVQAGASVPGVFARLGTHAGLRTSSDTDLTLTIVAEADSRAGGPYQLRLRTREGSYAVQPKVLSIQVNVLHPPRVNSFWINNREDSTKNPRLTLHHQAMYDPTHYRVCAAWGTSQCISSARWQAYRGDPVTFDLEALCNYWKVYFQLKNEAGESLPASQAGIQFYRIEYIEQPVSGARAYELAKDNGFRFTAKPLDDNARCDVGTRESALVLRVQKKNALLGAKCEFEIFAGRRLHEDYSFFGFADESDQSPLSGFRFVTRPVRGARDMRTVIRGWVEPGASAFHYFIEEYQMNGPCHLESALGAWDR